MNDFLKVQILFLIFSIFLSGCVESLELSPPQPLGGDSFARSDTTALSWSPTHPGSKDISRLVQLNYHYLLSTTVPQTTNASFNALITDIARSLNALPPSKKFVILRNEIDSQASLPENTLLRHPLDVCKTSSGALTSEHCIWLEHGVQAVRNLTRTIFSALRSAGVTQIDGVILDSEYWWGTWTMSSNQLTAIQNDPRFLTQLYPLLGFGLTDFAAQIANWPRPATNWIKGTNLLNEQLFKYQNQALYEPIREIFGDITMSQYGVFKEDRYCGDRQNTLCGISEANGHPMYLFSKGKDSTIVGNAQSPSIYGSLYGIAHSNTPSEMGASYPLTPDNALKYMLNQDRSIAMVDDTERDPWIARKTWVDSQIVGDGIAGSRHYDEAIRHLALTGVKRFLYWNWTNAQAFSDPNYSVDNFADERSLDQILSEFNSIAGYDDLKWLDQSLVPWSADEYIVTRSRAGGRIVTRITLLNLNENDSAQSHMEFRSDATVIHTSSLDLVFDKGISISSGDDSIGVWIIQPPSSGPVRISNRLSL